MHGMHVQQIGSEGPTAVKVTLVSKIPTGSVQRIYITIGLQQSTLFTYFVQSFFLRLAICSWCHSGLESQKSEAPVDRAA